MLTKTQKIALDALKRFLSNKKSKEIALIGKAGTGKTYLLKLLALDKIDNTIGCAISHQAKDVLNASIGIPCNTVAQLIFLTQNIATDKTQFFSNKSKWDFAKEYKVILIDEASMIDKQCYEYFHQIYPRSKFIWIGDKGQLPAIEESSKLPNDGWSVFDHVTSLELKENVRSGEDNPLLQLTNYLYNSENLELNKLTDVNILSGKGYTTIDSKTAFHLLEQNSDLISLSYSNYIRNAVNEKIHNRKYDTEFAVGEKYISNMNFIYINGIPSIYNSERLTINEIVDKSTFTVTPINFGTTNIFQNNIFNINWNEILHRYNKSFDKFEIVFYKLKFKEKGNDSFNVISCKNTDFNSLLSFIADLAKFYKPIDNKLSVKIWNIFWLIKGSYLELSYSYCATTHKAQGSTYENVIVWVDDILSCKIPTKTKARALYTACSRPKNICYLVNKSPIDE